MRRRQLLTACQLADLVDGKPGADSAVTDWRLFEVDRGRPDAFLQSHIPGAGYIDTDALEEAPLWNKVDDQVLLRYLLDQGIRHDTTVVLYGRSILAVARAAHLLLYGGVADVRILDGGYAAWCNAALPSEAGLPHRYPAAADFGIAFPACPHYLIDTSQAKALLQQSDGALVSIRSWSEFTGQTSGYSYIDARGDIPGARWGRAGKNVNDMCDFHQPDGSMNPAADINAFWRLEGINAQQDTAFYCGTGWRASVAFFYAWLMGWERISVYDGGWYEWSLDPDNPRVCRAGNGEAGRAKNVLSLIKPVPEAAHNTI